MRVRYRGVNSPTGRVRRGGCSACGQSSIGRTEMALLEPYRYFYHDREFNFYLGREYDVPDELGKALLNKYSYVNGNKLQAFEEVT